MNQVSPDQNPRRTTFLFSLPLADRRWPIQARVWLEWARGGSCLSGLFESAALNSIRNRWPTPGRRRLDTARHLDTTPRTITVALRRMRDRYNFPTNEALIAAALKLEWIPLAIDTHRRPKAPPQPGRRGGLSLHGPAAHP